MVNDNFRWRAPRMSSADQLRPNPAWRQLRVGDIVKPNVKGRHSQPQHGKIMGINGETAKVRWQDRSESAFELPYLIKV